MYKSIHNVKEQISQDERVNIISSMRNYINHQSLKGYKSTPHTKLNKSYRNINLRTQICKVK